MDLGTTTVLIEGKHPFQEITNKISLDIRGPYFDQYHDSSFGGIVTVRRSSQILES